MFLSCTAQRNCALDTAISSNKPVLAIGSKCKLVLHHFQKALYRGSLYFLCQGDRVGIKRMGPTWGIPNCNAILCASLNLDIIVANGIVAVSSATGILQCSK